ncbi:efflux RND transporter periplasmic adaptor subunit [Pseudomonas lijiangensis]|uniref:Efflux RND transporter periplasmic adaptor subunit n=1 Tax=Pseudomonas lijiangensis TaxID=2995658 RepID=A0ABX8HKA6_9PSED|nr:efflux RND transporter periplasmic adaptor subunit [Pseudomonas lijiangensis]MBX8498602.1 efflux RND transporter periplasmic adaptor subunit [Pseudomonas lijiangensis]MBX8503509.1 efflux RND transporter periplasmic adaptor subunit [Pseudomonas lijiangensis]QWU80909.1 efflux RND transporter periplasmic adaptor subunit [Pseudomonas lijiangensis]
MPSLFRLDPGHLLLCVALAALTACGKPTAEPDMPPQVKVERVKTHPLIITTELNGRLVSPRVAEVRARVAGIVLQRVYREGSDVRQGDVLFRIDPAPFQADLESAEAALRKAQATEYQARLQAERYAELTKISAVSRQDAENARASFQQALADVASTRAALKRARLNLDYATVTAPISGRIGKALVTEGALVGQGDATVLATIQQLQPIYADINQSTRQISELRRSLQQGELQQLEPGQITATLIQEDGSPYPHKGTLLFSDLTVDQGTGQVTLRSEFPNSKNELLPGSFIRVQLDQARTAQGITVIQRAVQRDAAGKALVLIVDEGKVLERSIELGSVQGNRWIVKNGLNAGDQVIVSGLQHVQPGSAVTVQEEGADALAQEQK